MATVLESEPEGHTGGSVGSSAPDAVVVRFAGDSGDGMQLTGGQFTLSTALAGNDLATFPDFPAEIRAPQGTLFGVSAFQINFGSTEIDTAGDAPDVLVAMNPAALKTNVGALKPGGLIIADTGEFNKRNLEKAKYDVSPLEDGSLEKWQVLAFDISALTLEAVKPFGLGNKEALRCKNMWTLGLALWMFDRDRQPLIDWLKGKFAKAPVLADANIAALNAGHAYGETAELAGPLKQYHLAPVESEPGLYRTVTGAEAVSYGLVAGAQLAGLDLFFGGYPITPASAILHNLARLKEFGVTTFQAEDEIAAIAAAIGASFGGQLGVTSSSAKNRALGMPSGMARAVSARGTDGPRSGCEQAVAASATASSRNVTNLGIQSLQLGDFLRRQLGEIEVALGIAREAVCAVDGAAAAADKPAVGREQADARDLVGDEHKVAVIHPDLHGVMEVAPFGEEGARTVEHLHAVVLAIADQDLAEAVDPDGVRRREGARPCARSAPGRDQGAVGREAMDAGIAVAVGDVDLAVDRLRCRGRMIEGCIERRPVPRAQRLQELAIAVEAQDLMGVAVGDQDRAMGRSIDVVRIRQRAFAPGAGKTAVAIEDQDRPVGAALGDMHATFAIDHQVGNEAEALDRRQLRPFAMDGVAPVAQDDGVALVGHRSTYCGVPDPLLALYM